MPSDRKACGLRLRSKWAFDSSIIISSLLSGWRTLDLDIDGLAGRRLAVGRPAPSLDCDFTGGGFRLDPLHIYMQQTVVEPSFPYFDPVGQHEIALELAPGYAPIKINFLVIGRVLFLLAPDDQLVLFDLDRSEEHTSELQSPCNLVCRLLLYNKNSTNN